VVGAVIFDLGGTLVDWPEWEEAVERWWVLSYDHLTASFSDVAWLARQDYVTAMRTAEAEHWRRVDEELWSGPATALVENGFRRMGLRPDQEVLLAALDSYAKAVEGEAVAFSDARKTLSQLRQEGYRLGLLSNTWWAAQWHDADLAAQGLTYLLDEVLYTSDLPHSKPHPSVFLKIASRLGVQPAECVMVGDNMLADISGALHVGMRAVWKRNDRPWPKPKGVKPSATIERLADLPAVLRMWGDS
jgi:HAD superfamily hydrolase (TIGR01509 family)